MMESRTYTQGEFNSIFSHLPLQTVRWWVESDLIQWVSEHHDRRGKHRQYALENLYQVGLVEELMSLNFPVKAVRQFMLVFQDSNEFWADDYILILNKVADRPQEDYVKIDPDTGATNIIAYDVPGWHSMKIVPSQLVGKCIPDNSLGVIMISLNKIVEKVNNFIKLAGL